MTKTETWPAVQGFGLARIQNIAIVFFFGHLFYNPLMPSDNVSSQKGFATGRNTTDRIDVI